MKPIVRVLLVEDREDDAILIVRELARGGFQVEYVRVETPDELKRALQDRAWDLVISDYSLPQFTALDALAEVKLTGLDVPFIIVSGTVGEDVAVSALKGGAHDFIPKNNLRRFLPAVERELREAESRRRRREAERELQASTEMVAAVFTAAPLPMALLDPQGVVLRWNPAAERTFCWTAEEVVGREPPFSTEESRAEYHERLARVRAGEVIAAKEIVRRRKDGTPLTLLVFSAPIRDATGSVISVLDVLQDITEQRGLEAQFRQAQKMEAVGRLAGGIAHDFNNVLTVIEGHASLALTDDATAGSQLREDLQEILDAAKRAASFTRQLLAFSRQQVIQPTDVDLNVLTHDLSKLLKRAIGDNIMLDVQLHEQPVWVHADRSQLEQVVMNLVVNARDAIEDTGRITLRTGIVTLRGEMSMPPGEYSMLSVQDDGHGIPPDVLTKMFEPFFTTKESGKGTGLGLSTVYGIVTQNGGTIHVDSQPGQGATFTILLPRTQPGANGHELRAPDVLSAVEKQTEQQPHQPTVLLVEDESAIRKVVTRTLDRAGYKVLLAADAESALAQLSVSESIDVLLTDVMLPNMRGHELAVAACKLRPHLRVVLMSGYSAEEIPGDAKYPYLEKPFSPAELVRLMAGQLGAAPNESN